MPQRSARSGKMQLPVGLPAVVLPPSHLSRIDEQVLPADMMMLPHLGTAQAAEVALSLVRAGTVQAERHRVIDPPHLETGMQSVPAARLVSVHDGARGDPLAQGGDRIGFTAEHEGQRLAAALTSDHD